MTEKNISPELKKKILSFQREEVTSAAIYSGISRVLKNDPNAAVLALMADEETKHAFRWQAVTGLAVRANSLKVWWFVFLARFLGLTFAVKKLEKGEASAQVSYETVAADFPDVTSIIEEEEKHEKALIDMIDEERLRYAGSVVLGLNDALVELTGALAGFTFAFQNTRMIAMTGLITGISAAFSMASSEYLSQRSDGDGSVSPAKSAMYTGFAYIVTVILLVLPYFLFTHFLVALAATLTMVFLIIFLFNYYLCTAKDLSFRKHFFEMFFMSVGVTILSFGVGMTVKYFLGLDV